MREYLVVYDYGMGGIWAWVSAQSKKQIEKRYPKLHILDEVPDWMGQAYLEGIYRLDIDADAGHPFFEAALE